MATRFDAAFNTQLLPPMPPIAEGGGRGSECGRMPPLTNIGALQAWGATTPPITGSGTAAERKAGYAGDTSRTGVVGGGTIMLSVSGEPVGEADGRWGLAAEPAPVPRGGRRVKRPCGQTVTLDEENETALVEGATQQFSAFITDDLLTKLPRSIQLVDMIDAAVTRNLAVPAALQALAQMGGEGGGGISILPVWSTTSVLVLAPGEEALERTVGEVTGRAERRGETRYFFKQAFTEELSKAVSVLGVDLWLDGRCLRAQVEDVASKTRAEGLLQRERTFKFPDLVVSATAVADAPDPTSATGAGAGPPSLPLPEDGAVGACSSNAFSAPEAVVLARSPGHISSAARGGGSGGDGWNSGVGAGLKLAQAPAAAPATVHRSGLASAVSTASASRQRGGDGAALCQEEQCTRPTVGAAATPAAVEVEVSTTPVTALGPSRRGPSASSAAAATRRASDAGDGGGNGDGRGTASSLSSSSGTASGPPASSGGHGGSVQRGNGTGHALNMLSSTCLSIHDSLLPETGFPRANGCAMFRSLARDLGTFD